MTMTHKELPAAAAPGNSLGDKIRAAFAFGKVRWGMLALVFFATTLNYVDRAALGVLQPVLAKAMAWTAQDYANINFWFQVATPSALRCRAGLSTWSASSAPSRWRYCCGASRVVPMPLRRPQSAS